MNAADILKAPIRIRYDLNYFIRTWQLEVFNATQQFQERPTSKGAGQLKLIYNRLEAAGMNACLVMPVVVQNWQAFVACVRSVDPTASAPEQPSIGYTLKHIQVLIDYPPDPSGQR